MRGAASSSSVLGGLPQPTCRLLLAPPEEAHRVGSPGGLTSSGTCSRARLPCSPPVNRRDLFAHRPTTGLRSVQTTDVAAFLLAQPAPDPGFLVVIERPLKALFDDDAVSTHRLGSLHLFERRSRAPVGEEQLGVLVEARGHLSPIHCWLPSPVAGLFGSLRKPHRDADHAVGRGLTLDPTTGDPRTAHSDKAVTGVGITEGRRSPRTISASSRRRQRPVGHRTGRSQTAAATSGAADKSNITGPRCPSTPIASVGPVRHGTIAGRHLPAVRAALPAVMNAVFDQGAVPAAVGRQPLSAFNEGAQLVTGPLHLRDAVVQFSEVLLGDGQHVVARPLAALALNPRKGPFGPVASSGCTKAPPARSTWRETPTPTRTSRSPPATCDSPEHPRSSTPRGPSACETAARARRGPRGRRPDPRPGTRTAH